ncbi:MAG: head-tail connector protein [Rickettsiales bacterium]
MTILRNRSLVRVVAPTNEPITLTEAKLYLRVDHVDEDVLINDLIVAARMHAEHWLKRSILTQTWKLAYDDYLTEEVLLPMGPVSSIDNVTIIDRDEDSEVLDSGLYYLNASKDAIIFDECLSAHRIEITYVTGYGDASMVPKSIKQGMLSHIASMYDGRGEGTGHVLPEQSVCLYMPFREVSL